MLDLTDAYESLISRHGLTALAAGGGIGIHLGANGHLVLTKDGDLALGPPSFDALNRLVMSWSLYSPALRGMFAMMRNMADRQPEIARTLENVFKDRPSKHSSPFLDSDRLPLYRAAADDLNATEVSQSVLAGAIVVVAANLLVRFKDDLGPSWILWNAAGAKFGGVSAGQVVLSAANGLRHGDEWSKARFAGRDPTKEQLRSMNHLQAALGRPQSTKAWYQPDLAEDVLDLLCGGDFDRLASAILTFANDLAVLSSRPDGSIP